MEENISKKKKLSDRVWDAVLKNLITVMIVAITATAFFMAFYTLVIDSDTNFILYEGKRIATGGIQYWNTASVAGKMRTVVQQWLYDLIVYRIYAMAGWHGLLVFNMAQATALGVLLFRLCRVTENGRKSSLIASLIALFVFVFSYGGSRPEMITGILLAANAILIEKYVSTSKTKYLLMCTPLITLEANLHASMWIMHAVLMLPYAIPYEKIMKPLRLPECCGTVRSYDRLPIAAVILASPVFALANPYGTDGLMYLFNSAGMNLGERAKVAEMQYPYLISFMSLPYLALLFFTGRFIKKARIEHVLLFAGGFCVFGMAIRNIILLSLAAVPLSAFVLTSLHAENLKKPVFTKKQTVKASVRIGDLVSGIRYSADEKKAEETPQKKETLPYAVMFICASVIAVCIWAIGVVAVQPIRETDTALSPIRAEKYIKAEKKKSRNRMPARVLTGYSNGAYFERMGEKIFIDARPELWRKKINGRTDIYDEYISTQSITEKKYQEIKKKYRFDYIIAANGSVLQARCQNDPNADRAVRGNGYTLYRVRE